MQAYWNHKKVLITGGLGFIGSTLALRLLSLGARVTLVDAMIPFLGGNEFNLAPAKENPHLRVNISNITDRESMEHLVTGQDHIFHLASQVSHVLGQTDPFPDLNYNIIGTATLLEACKKNNPSVKILYTGTRGQYGPSMKNPISEEASLAPLGLHEITKLTAEQVLLEYHKRHRLRCVLTRLTNIYGPRAQMKSDKYGVVNWFIRQAIEGKTISLHGGGNYKRDFLFVDDCVNDLLQLAACEDAYGQIYNVGNTEITSFAELAQLIVDLTGKGTLEQTPFTAERKLNEPGDIYLDVRKLQNTITWKERTSLREGLQKTILFYEQHKEHYF